MMILMVSRVFFFLLVLTLGWAEGSLAGKQAGTPDLCSVESFPSEIQTRLKTEFSSWKIEGPDGLSTYTRERWKSVKPLACPGIAKGHFDDSDIPSYAILVVSKVNPQSAYKFLIFTRLSGHQFYEPEVLGSGEAGADNFFIHAVRLSKFFDKRSRLKFHAHSQEGILLVDAAENEYGVEVYFRADRTYRHQPIDY
jgi:hypothetical protein